jgi:hypothetical protein
MLPHLLRYQQRRSALVHRTIAFGNNQPSGAFGWRSMMVHTSFNPETSAAM